MNRAKEMKAMGSYGTIGLEIVLSVLFGLFLGMKLDDWLGTSPWMTLVWFGFGCVAAGRAVYRTWKAMQAAAKREEEQEGNPPQQFPDDKSRAWQREDEEKAEREAEAVEAGREGSQEAATKSDEETR